MTGTSDLVSSVARLAQAKVLCVGDLMLDRFVYGQVERVSPEAPIPVVSVERELAMLGGAGNVVRNLVALGAETCFISVIGDDQASREVIQLVGAEPRIEPHLLVEPKRRTTIKTRFVAGSQQLLRADRETIAPIGAPIAAQLLQRAEEALRDHAVMILSDYGKGVLGPEAIETLIAAARAAGVKVVIDPKGRDYARYAGATLLTPNRRELMDAVGLPTGTDDEVVAAGRALFERCAIDALLVTRSQDGMTLIQRDGAVVHLPAKARQVFDVSGAGDTVVATVAAALSGGVALPDACMLANVAAGIVVGKIGTAVTHADEIVTALQTEDLAQGESKVLSLHAALDQVAAWRSKGLKIGFTNGCFDLLHPGHVSLLAQSRAQCDRLVVGLNSDASVKRLKGETRPVQTETARAVVLASLSHVDAVVIFPEDTPLSLIEAIKPDVL
ncbi:MAG: D-glycero-beta-D-manno-heptose-7-phosphate kinase, partial [Alphaproteobacteria bacterium]|nr:D-glycero-beta-D-manno-heptose-7-phosphate kinase [Alphaproteobacteria bacterium]